MRRRDFGHLEPARAVAHACDAAQPSAGQLTLNDAIHFFGPKRSEIGLISPLIYRLKLICLSCGGSTPQDSRNYDR